MACIRDSSFLGRVRDFMSAPMVYSLNQFFFVKHLFTTLVTNPRALSISASRLRAFADFLTLLPLETPPESPLYPFLAIQKEARGVVLDLGPGTGINMQFFDKDKVDMIYGAEPSFAMREQLHDEVKKLGLEDKYRVMECGAEYETLIPALKSEGLLTSDSLAPVFDTIVCCKVLCSVPSQKSTIEGLVKLLKPGGKFMLCEHIRNRWETKNGSWAARAVQRVFMLIGWETVLCGCDLERDTAEVVERAGEWEDRRVTFVSEWSTIPFCYGWFEKA